MSILDQDVSNDARESVERILDKIEEIMPELREATWTLILIWNWLNDEMEMRIAYDEQQAEPDNRYRPVSHV